MAYSSPKLKLVKDNILRIYHPELMEPKTYLTASVAATETSLTVQSNEGFSNTDPQDLLLFENLGTENAEIKRVNGAITAGTALTSQAVTFAHAISAPIAKILFNQVEISGASTLTGSKTTIATTALTVSGEYTEYVVTGTTYSYYFTRFYNSLSTTPYYSAYSDGVISTDFAVNTVGFIRRNAFNNINEVFGGRFNADWIFDQIYLLELDIAKELKRWSWLTAFETDLGNVSTGMRSIAVPTDIEDSKTNKSILGLRIETDRNMDYIDKTEYERIMEGVAFTTLSSTASIGDITLTLTDSRDFEDSGSVNIGGTSYSYTSNARATGVLSGLIALTAEITGGTNVWQNIAFGLPRRYTVYDGNIYFDVPPSSDYNGRNIWIDYYKTPSRLDSDTDTPLVNDAQLIISGLEMAIKKVKGNGEIAPTEASWLEYSRRKAKLIQNELSGQKIYLVPNVPNVYQRANSWWRT